VTLAAMPTAAQVIVTITLAAALAVVFGWIAAALRRRRASWLARTRARRALAGESAAEGLLEDAGFTIVDRQVRTTWRFYCDDDAVETELRCDLLVEHDGRLLVAEVKTGQAAPRLDTAATRRQLLEYQVAYGASGVVLVDAEVGELRVVDFPLPAPDDDEAVVDDDARRAGSAVLAPLLVGIGVGAALGHVVTQLML
jgi:hypothetical protein